MTDTTERLYQCPACWGYTLLPLPIADAYHICDCGEALTEVDLRSRRLSAAKAARDHRWRRCPEHGGYSGRSCPTCNSLARADIEALRAANEQSLADTTSQLARRYDVSRDEVVRLCQKNGIGIFQGLIDRQKFDEAFTREFGAV